MEKQYFFSSDFDVNWLLSDDATENLESQNDTQCFNSIDEFELSIIQTSEQLSSELRALDLAETQKNAKPVSGRQRELRLKELCKQKAAMEAISARSILEQKNRINSSAPEPVTSVPQLGTPYIREVLERCKKKTSKDDVLSRMKTVDGPLGKLREWVRNRHRVRIVLRGQGAPNAVVTAVVIAFDKHWNLVLRDGTEILLPPAKVTRNITKAGLEALDATYKRIDRRQNQTLLGSTGRSRKLYTRHLICTMVRGENIVLIQQT